MSRQSTGVQSVLSRMGCADQGPRLITRNPIGRLIHTRQRKRHTSGREECIRMETSTLKDLSLSWQEFEENKLWFISTELWRICSESGTISTNQIVLFLRIYFISWILNLVLYYTWRNRFTCTIIHYNQSDLVISCWISLIIILRVKVFVSVI